MKFKVKQSIEENIEAYEHFADNKEEEYPNKKVKTASKKLAKEEIEEEEV